MFLHIFITIVNTIWGEKKTLIKMIKINKIKTFYYKENSYSHLSFLNFLVRIGQRHTPSHVSLDLPPSYFLIIQQAPMK